MFVRRVLDVSGFAELSRFIDVPLCRVAILGIHSKIGRVARTAGVRGRFFCFVLLGSRPGADQFLWHKCAAPFWPRKTVDGRYTSIVGQTWRRFDGTRWLYRRTDRDLDDFVDEWP